MDAARRAVWLVLLATSVAHAVDVGGVWVLRFTHHDVDSTCRYTLTTGAPGGDGSTVSLAARGTCGDLDGTLDTATGDFQVTGNPFGLDCFVSGAFAGSDGASQVYGDGNCLFGGVTGMVGAPCTTEPCDYESCTGSTPCLIGWYYLGGVCGNGRPPEDPTPRSCDDGNACTVRDICHGGFCAGTPSPICEVAPGDCGPCAVHDAIGRCLPDVRSQCASTIEAASLHLGLRHHTVSWWLRARDVALAQTPRPAGLPELCVFDPNQGIVAGLRPSARCRDQSCWRPEHLVARYDDPGAVDALSLVRSRVRRQGELWLQAQGAVAKLGAAPLPFPLRVQYHADATICWESVFPVATRAEATVVKARVRSTPH